MCLSLTRVLFTHRHRRSPFLQQRSDKSYAKQINKLFVMPKIIDSPKSHRHNRSQQVDHERTSLPRSHTVHNHQKLKVSTPTFRSLSSSSLRLDIRMPSIKSLISMNIRSKSRPRSNIEYTSSTMSSAPGRVSGKFSTSAAGTSSSKFLERPTRKALATMD